MSDYGEKGEPLVFSTRPVKQVVSELLSQQSGILSKEDLPHSSRLDRFNTPENVRSIENILGDSKVLNMKIRSHVIEVREGEPYFIKDGSNDMAENGEYRRLNYLRIGKKLFYTMYSGTAGYGSQKNLRVGGSPFPGEFALVGPNGFMDDEDQDQLIKSWHGQTVRFAYSELAENGKIQLVDPLTHAQIVDDVNYAPK